MKDLERKVIAHEADISSFKKKGQQMKELENKSDEIDMDELEDSVDSTETSNLSNTKSDSYKQATSKKLPFIFSYN